MLRGIHGNLSYLRDQYLARWDKEWPHDDKYLRELAQEAATVDDCLHRMRECAA